MDLNGIFLVIGVNMNDFEFHTSLRGGTVNVRCEYWYNGDLRIKIIGVEWGFSGDHEVECTSEELSNLEDKAYEEFKLINQV